MCPPGADQQIIAPIQAESQESSSAREDLEAQLEAAQTRAQAAMEAVATAQGRAAAAEAARDEADLGRAAADRSRRETEAQARAAAEVAAADRDERASAEGLSEQLKAEADRRAKVFHNAVRAAIGKVQAELEAERDTLEARCALARPSSCLQRSRYRQDSLHWCLHMKQVMDLDV